MPIIFDEVTAEVADEDRSVQAPQGEREPSRSEPQVEEQMRRYLRKLGERYGRLFAD